jgi:hypothetical protein
MPIHPSFDTPVLPANLHEPFGRRRCAGTDGGSDNLFAEIALGNLILTDDVTRRARHDDAAVSSR